MEERKILFYDDNGQFVSDGYIQPNEMGEFILPPNATFKPLPEPNYKPVFDEQKDDWIETATDEEINPPVTPTPPSDIDQLKDSDAFLLMQVLDTQKQLQEERESSADLILQLVAKGVL